MRFLSFVTMLCLTSVAELLWNTENGFPDWNSTSNCSAAKSEAGILMTISDKDPGVTFTGLDLNPRQITTFSYTYRATGDLKKSGQLYFARKDEPLSDTRLWRLPVPKTDGEWHTVTLTHKNIPKPWGWLAPGNIETIRFDPTDSSNGTFEISKIHFSHQEKDAMTPKKVIAQLADPQIGFKDYDGEMDRFRREINSLNYGDCEAAIICGDMMHIASKDNFQIFKQELSRLKIPVFLVPGNHDVNRKNRENYKEIFGPTFYAANFPFPGYRLVVIDTELWQKPIPEETEKMEQMILKELEEAKASNLKVILAAHASIFVKTEDEPEEYFNLPKSKREWLKNLFEHYPIVAYFAGHSHTTFTILWHGVLMSNCETTSVAFDNINYGYRRFVLDDNMIYFNTIPLAK